VAYDKKMTPIIQPDVMWPVYVCVMMIIISFFYYGGLSPNSGMFDVQL